ncbi:MAG: molybdenum ABC transporter ATP-binding protein [Hyphomicrobiaceae bacterium]|nr:MAG: molybdenum ABC transporter ATP-binding protein [Hyphomicrobiaceae bacterium]
MSSVPAVSVALKGNVDDFTLDVAFEAPAGVTAIFGHSGSGKTTILRCIAGLTRLDGKVVVDGDVWQDETSFLPVFKREIGYVFQEASLFPHLCVRRNILYGAQRAVRQADSRPALAFDDIVSLLGIGRLLDRDPETLSGGERQRVALARALLSKPRILLMDEPLAALDRAAKDEILHYLEELHERLSMPVLYVSHDQAEVERLADTLVLLEHGRVRAAGALTDLQTDSSLPLLAAQQASVMLRGTVAGIDEAYALTTFSVPGGTLLVPGRHGAPGDSRRLRIAASDVSFILAPPANSTILNCLPARILEVEGMSGAPQVSVVASLGHGSAGARIAARITRRSRDALAIAPGLALYAQIKSVALVTARAGRSRDGE